MEPAPLGSPHKKLHRFMIQATSQKIEVLWEPTGTAIHSMNILNAYRHKNIQSISVFQSVLLTILQYLPYLVNRWYKI